MADERCMYVNEGGLCGQFTDDSVHVGWTDVQSGMVFKPLHEFTTEVVTTELVARLRSELEAANKEIERQKVRVEGYGTAYSKARQTWDVEAEELQRRGRRR